MILRRILGGILLLIGAGTTIHADDWPQYRGQNALGVWNESGIVDKFPNQGLKVLWRAPLRGGYTGP